MCTGAAVRSPCRCESAPAEAPVKADAASSLYPKGTGVGRGWGNKRIDAVGGGGGLGGCGAGIGLGSLKTVVGGGSPLFLPAALSRWAGAL